jgi:rare lipoprotein A
LAIAACSRGGHQAESRIATERGGAPAVDPKTGTSASPRLAREGETIPKGGGSFKLGAPYKIAGRWYVPREEPGYDASGIASWYGADFHGRKTANGEIYDMNALTAAHPTLPMPSYAYVTNLDNGRTVLVRINDRGPYAHDRIIDLSRMTAQALDSEGRGLARVRVRYAGRAPLSGDDRRERQHLAAQPWWQGRRGTAVASRAPAMTRPLTVPPAVSHAPVDSGSGWSPLAHRAARSSVGGP